MINKLICCLRGHDYKLLRVIAPQITEQVCQRCGAEFGVHHKLNIIMTLDDELRQKHDELLTLYKLSLITKPAPCLN